MCCGILEHCGRKISIAKLCGKSRRPIMGAYGEEAASESPLLNFLFLRERWPVEIREGGESTGQKDAK